MFGIENIGLFIVSGLLLNILPGPDSLLIIGRSASQGFKAGSAAALGIGTGTFVHILAAVVGLSAILATSAMAFTLVKVLGGIYLIYIAISMLLKGAGEPGDNLHELPRQPYGKIFMQGLLTNVLNPKIAVFFLAFMPQFIAVESDNKALAFLVLGVIFNVNGMLWCHFLAWMSATIGARMTASKRVSRWLNRLAATLFGYFGIKLALTTQS